MPSRPCVVHGCPNLVPQGTTRCTTHRATQERTRGTRQQRGYGTEHQATLRYLRAAYPHGPCGRCGKPGTWDLKAPPNVRLTGGHIDPDGPSTPDNEQPEHLTCNVREARRRHLGG